MTSEIETAVTGKDNISIGRPVHSRLSRLGRWAFIIAACALFAGGAYYTWRTWFAAGDSTNNVLTEVVTRGDIENTITATGTLQPKDYVDVGTQVSGQLKHLLVDIGAMVTKGQLLAEIDRRCGRVIKIHTEHPCKPYSIVMKIIL